MLFLCIIQCNGNIHCISDKRWCRFKLFKLLFFSIVCFLFVFPVLFQKVNRKIESLVLSYAAVGKIFLNLRGTHIHLSYLMIMRTPKILLRTYNQRNMLLASANILLSSLALSAISLIFCVNALCALFMNLCCDLSIALFFSMHFL